MNLTNYGRRHLKLFTNCHVSCDTLYQYHVAKIEVKIFPFKFKSHFHKYYASLNFHISIFFSSEFRFSNLITTNITLIQ